MDARRSDAVPRVDFYLVPGSGREPLWRVACRIAEKAWLGGDRVLVHTTSEQEAARVDEALWTFRQESFVPHARYPCADADLPPVLVGSGEPPPEAWEVLVNLSDAVPAFYEHFKRIAELVAEDPDAREQGRARYRLYRERGCELHSHHL